MFVLNILILAYIGFMVYWWANQGLFSSAIHLILTIMAGVIALSVWEPLSSMLLGMTPESAWGIGLLLPFGLSLLLMRFAFDKMVPGNLNFPHLADSIVGGSCGFLSGCLTTGMLIMGLQMIGMPSLFGYQPYALDRSGKVVPYQDNKGNSKTLWLKVDAGTAGFFGLLSDNAFSPILTQNTMGVYRKNLVETISLNADTRVQGANSRRSLRSENVRVLGQDGEKPGLASVDQLPDTIRHHLQTERRTVVIGVEISLPAAGDRDGVMRIKPNQVRLNHSTEEDQYSNDVEESYPVGYIQTGEYVSFAENQEYVRSEISATQLVVHFVFQIPMSHEPNFIEIKRARLNLRAIRRNAIRDPGRIASLIRSVTRMAQIPAGNVTMKDRDTYVKKSATLPFPLNRNTLPAGVETYTVEGLGSRIKAKHYLLRGSAVIKKGATKTRLDDKLRVPAVYTQPSAAMLKLVIGPMGSKKKNLYDKITSHGSVDEAPRIIDVNGDVFWAMGYVVEQSTAKYSVSIDPKSPIKTMGDLNIGQLSPGQTMILYFQLPKNKVLAYVKHGKHELVNMGFLSLK